MKKITLFYIFISSLFATINAQTSGSFYVNLLGNPSICSNGTPRTLVADYNRLLVASSSASIFDYHEPIAITPYFQSLSLTSTNELYPTGSNQDDFFSNVFQLPFLFRFFGDFSDQVVVGSNGVISFNYNDVDPVTRFCPYFVGDFDSRTLADLEANGPNDFFPVKNAIMGVFQDINFEARPDVTTSINYFVKDTGIFAAPNRVFVVNYNRVLLYQDPNNLNNLQTYQIVLYEGTNIVDVNVVKRTQNNWIVTNGGVLGIINGDGTRAHWPDNHNTTDVWNVISPSESWRFTPLDIQQGPPNAGDISASTLRWFKNGIVQPALQNQESIIVSAVAGDEYQCKVSHSLATGDVSTVVSRILKFKTEQNPALLEEPKSQYIFCEGSPINIDQNDYILNGQSAASYNILYYETEADAIATSSNNITNLTNYIPSTGAPVVGQEFTKDIWVSITDNSIFCASKIRKLTIKKSIPPSGTFSYGDTAASVADDFCLGDTNIRLISTSTLTLGGSFYTNSTGPNGISINSSTGAINFANAIAGNYSVFYRFPISEGCPVTPDLEVIVKVVSCGCQNTEFKICSSDTSFNLVAPVLPGATSYSWSGPGPNGGIYSSNLQNPTFVPYPTGATSPFVYKLTIKDAAGIVLCNEALISVISIPKANAGVLTNPINNFCDTNSAIILSDLLSNEDAGTWSIVGVAPADGTFDSVLGTFTPSSLSNGVVTSTHTFKYTVVGVVPCAGITKDISITIYNAPRSGTLVTGGITTFCESETIPLNLFTLIQDYDLGGSWSTTNTGGTLNATTGIYNFAINATSGTFTYKVGTTPCSNTETSVSITIKKTPNSGVATTGQNGYCDTSTTDINLYSLIDNEDAGGTWTRLGSQTDGVFTAATGTFRPNALTTSSSTSQFKYTVDGLPCSAKSTTVSLTVFNSPSAGVASVGTNTVCEISTTPILLSSLITGKDSGGTWERTSGSGGTFFNPIDGSLASFTPGSNTTTSTFKYTVGLLACGLDSEEVTITIKKAPISGIAKIDNFYCDNASAINLSELITDEDANGTWTRGSGTYGTFDATIGTFTPTSMTSTTTNVCTFVYTVAGLPCSPATTTVTLSIDKSPNAGTVNLTPNVYCDSDTNVISLSNLITGEDPGTWTQISGTGGIFDDNLGTFKLNAGTTTSKFKYTVGANTACPKDEIEVTITVKPAANAGTAIAGGLVVCESDVILYKLADLLVNEQSGGSWISTATGGTFDPVLGTYKAGVGATSGVFTYIIVGQTPCANDSENLVLTINNAITPNFTQVPPICEKDNLAALPTTSLNGVNGSWSPTISNLETTEYTFKPNAGSCAFVQKMTIVVNDLPSIELPQNPFICVDINGIETTNTVLTTGLSDSSYNFEWYNETIPTILPLGTSSSYTALKIGTYRVDVTNKSTLCKSSAKVKVVSSLPPNSMTFVTSSYFEDEKLITVNVLPVSNYEYQIDNGVFQDSNQFTVMTSGDHKIVVRDKYGCNQIEDVVSLLDFPKFFTPNGDGFNDFWTINDIKSQPNSKIFIFDRFGKLMKQMTIANKGWDGTNNGVPLPADDYWFTVNYEEGLIQKTFKSNFSLKR